MTEEQIYAILQKLAEQLQTTVEHLWGVLVRQAYVEGLTIFVLLLIGGLISFYVVRRFPTWIKSSEGKSSYEADWEFAKCLGGFFWLVVYAIMFYLEIGNMMTALLNPEYWALQQVLNLLGG